MSGGGGGSYNTGGYPLIQTGPTPEASAQALQAQLSGIQGAEQAATFNTQAALQSLMGQYSTGLTYGNPLINTGQQATAQLNYMLGMPAINPGAAPTAPTINQADLMQYVNTFGAHTPEGNQPTGTFTPANPLGTSYYSPGPGNTGGSFPMMQNNIGMLIPQDIQQQVQAAISNGSLKPDETTFNAQIGDHGVNSFDVNQRSPGAYNLKQFGLPDAYYIDKNWRGAGDNSLTPGYYTNLGNTQNESLAQAIMGSPDLSNLAKQNIQKDPSLSPMYQQALQQYQTQNQQWQQENDIYNRYQQKGVATPADLSAIVQNLPGFQFQQQQGISGIQNAASANGMLNSGALLRQLDQFGQGLSQTYYNNYLGQLQGLAGIGANANQAAMNSSNQTGQSAAGLFSSLGDTLGNAALSAGQAQASAYLSPLENQEMRAQIIGQSQVPVPDQGGGLGGILSGAGSLMSGMSSMFGAL